MTRDPRIDPRPGDVLRRPRQQRMVLVRYFGGVNYALVPGTKPNYGLPHFKWSDLASWRKWAKTAEVVHVAD